MNSDDLLPNIFFRRSTDNGITWSSQVKISTSGTVRFESAPFQLLASASSVYVVWQENEHEIAFKRSTDNGATWKTIVNLSNNPGASTSPEIAVSGSNIYVAWHQLNSEDQFPNIFFKRSSNSGASWAAKINLSNTAQAGNPAIAATGSNVYVVWGDSSVGNGDILFRRSSDNAASWMAVKNLSNNSGGSGTPQIAV